MMLMLSKFINCLDKDMSDLGSKRTVRMFKKEVEESGVEIAIKHSGDEIVMFIGRLQSLSDDLKEILGENVDFDELRKKKS